MATVFALLASVQIAAVQDKIPEDLILLQGTAQQVQGCNTDLAAVNKLYCIKKRVCPEHMKSLSVVLVGGGPGAQRYCHQCGKFELLTMFDGTKRSCRTALVKARDRQRVHRKAQSMSEKSAGAAAEQPQGRVHQPQQLTAGLRSAGTQAVIDQLYALLEGQLNDYQLQQLLKQLLWMGLEQALQVPAQPAALPPAPQAGPWNRCSSGLGSYHPMTLAGDRALDADPLARGAAAGSHHALQHQDLQDGLNYISSMLLNAAAAARASRTPGAGPRSSLPQVVPGAAQSAVADQLPLIRQPPRGLGAAGTVPPSSDLQASWARQILLAAIAAENADGGAAIEQRLPASIPPPPPQRQQLQWPLDASGYSTRLHPTFSLSQEQRVPHAEIDTAVPAGVMAGQSSDQTSLLPLVEEFSSLQGRVAQITGLVAQFSESFWQQQADDTARQQ
eukprot:gene3717-3979_t